MRAASPIAERLSQTGILFCHKLFSCIRFGLRLKTLSFIGEAIITFEWCFVYKIKKYILL